MCIICVKPAGEKFPSKKTIKTMFRNNPDGAGLMYSDGQKVTIQKGLMTFGEFWRALQAVRDDKKTFVMHFRITTHGGTSQGMTHPFPLASDEKQLKKLNITSTYGIAHNGMIDLTSEATKISDTALFVKKYMYPLFKGGVEDYKLDLIEESISGSKMAILDRTGHVDLLGCWEEDEGLYYSNATYKAEKRTYNHYNDYFRHYYYDGYFDDWDDDETSLSYVDWERLQNCEPKKPDYKKLSSLHLKN